MARLKLQGQKKSHEQVSTYVPRSFHAMAGLSAVRSAHGRILRKRSAVPDGGNGALWWAHPRFRPGHGSAAEGSAGGTIMPGMGSAAAGGGRVRDRSGSGLA